MPVVGVGVLSAVLGAITATVCLAILVVALSALALVTALQHGGADAVPTRQ